MRKLLSHRETASSPLLESVSSLLTVVCTVCLCAALGLASKAGSGLYPEGFDLRDEHAVLAVRG